MVCPETEPALARLLEERNVGVLVLFGSHARGQAGPDSDVDLAALRSDGRPMTYRELADLQWALSGQVGGVIAAGPGEPRAGRGALIEGQVDLVDLARADVLLRFTVLREGRVVYCENRHLWVDFAAQTMIAYADIERFIEPCIAGVLRAARREEVG